MAWTAKSEGEHFKVLQLRPQSEQQLQELIKLHDTSEFDFWKAPSKVNANVDLMVAKSEEKGLLEFLGKHSMSHRILVEDLAKFIRDKESSEEARDRALKYLKSSKLRDDAANDDFGMSMADYHSYAEIVAFMERIHKSLPGVTRIISIGKSVEGRDIKGIQFGNPENTSKKVVWIDAGIHAREWTAVHTSVYFIYLIANGIRRDARLKEYLKSVDLLVLPCVNPDGYEFTRSDPRNPLVRMWRKNRSVERCANNTRGELRCCKGVDLNRNFAFRFAETGTSYFPCSEIYHGAGAFSEPESRAIRDAVLNTDLRGRIDAMISMHAYSQLWIYPFSHKRHTYPEDIAELKSVAQKAVNAIGQKFGTHYTYGNGPDIIYAYAGGSTDWAKQTKNVKYAYTIELRPSYFSWNGFILDRAQLIPTARETFDGILVVLETVAKSANKTSNLERFAVAQSDSRVGCKDLAAHCATWLVANPNICATRRITMMRDCRQTCGMCR